MSNSATIRELGPHDTGAAYRVMASLRELSSEIEFVTRVNELQRLEGYRVIGSFEDGDSTCVSVAGFRVAHNLAWGSFLYVDDLATLPERRGRGHAGALVAWLHHEAARLGCDEVHLDSGTHRHGAHRFYFGQGMHVSSFHFSVEPQARPRGAGESP
ncbi:MAG: GNAT family N-acetyltransferase [Actinomycetota bacterium]